MYFSHDGQLFSRPKQIKLYPTQIYDIVKAMYILFIELRKLGNIVFLFSFHCSFYSELL